MRFGQTVKKYKVKVQKKIGIERTTTLAKSMESPTKANISAKI